jgi:hypothetical protein
MNALISGVLSEVVIGSFLFTDSWTAMPPMTNAVVMASAAATSVDFLIVSLLYHTTGDMDRLS